MKYRQFFAVAIVCLLACVSCSQAAPRADSLTMTVPSWYDPANLPALGRAINQWNAAHPSASVVVRQQVGKRDAILQKLLLGSRRGDGGDIALVRNEWLGRLLTENLIEPLPDGAAATVRAQSLPALLPAIADEKHVWAWPFDADALVVWQRRDLAPDTKWDLAGLETCAAYCAQNKEKHNLRAAFAFPAARATNSALAFLPWYFSFGGKLETAGKRLTFAPEPAAQALRWLQNLAGRAASPAALEQNDVFSGLAGGAYAMTVGGSWERPMLAHQSRLAEKIVAQPIPGPHGEGVSLLGGWSFTLRPGYHAGATALLAALGAPAVQADKLHTSSLLPATRSTLADPWFMQNIDGPTFKTALQNGRALPLHPQLLAALEPLAVMVAETFLGQKDAALAAADAALAVADLSKVAETPTPAPVSPATLAAVCSDGARTIWPQQKLIALPRVQVGDRRLVALSALCPEAKNVQVEIRASDGYTKTVPAAQLGRTFLDPEALTIILAKDDGDAFTVRDAARITFTAAGKEAGLILSMGEKRRNISTAELKKMARDGKVSFAAILALPGWELNPDEPAVLIARDGYQKEIALIDLQKGRLALEGMHGEFPGLSSKHHIRELSEIRLP